MKSLIFFLIALFGAFFCQMTFAQSFLDRPLPPDIEAAVRASKNDPCAITAAVVYGTTQAKNEGMPAYALKAEVNARQPDDRRDFEEDANFVYSHDGSPRQLSDEAYSLCKSNLGHLYGVNVEASGLNNAKTINVEPKAANILAYEVGRIIPPMFLGALIVLSIFGLMRFFRKKK